MLNLIKNIEKEFIMIKKKEVKTYAYPTLLGYNIDDERNEVLVFEELKEPYEQLMINLNSIFKVITQRIIFVIFNYFILF